jgi:hypothetical protein
VVKKAPAIPAYIRNEFSSGLFDPETDRLFSIHPRKSDDP